MNSFNTNYSTTALNIEQQIDTNQNSSNKTLGAISCEVKEGIALIKENIEHDLSGDIETLEKVAQLLNYRSIELFDIKIVEELNIGHCNSYTVAFNNVKTFSVFSITSKTRFPIGSTWGDDFYITLESGFAALYTQLYVQDCNVISESEVSDNATYIIS